MQTDIISDILQKNNGQITRQQAVKFGINPRLLSNLVCSGKLERVDRGVYIDPAIFEDDMYILQYRFSKGIFFKDSALFLHHMIDRTPGTYQMNFPLGYHPTAIDRYPVKIYQQKPEWYEIGVELVKSPGQHLVRTYNVERTLCDILRTRDSSDAETIKQAMLAYGQMQHKDIHRLGNYADIFHVKDKIMTYMEVVL